MFYLFQILYKVSKSNYQNALQFIFKFKVLFNSLGLSSDQFKNNDLLWMLFRFLTAFKLYIYCSLTISPCAVFNIILTNVFYIITKIYSINIWL